MPEAAPETKAEQMPEPQQERDPRNDPLYRAILWVLVASVLLGAGLTLAGEALFGSRALAIVGLGMALVCGLLYWVLRLRARHAARREDQAARREEE
jgi:Flp pilus assembly protein TadB